MSLNVLNVYCRKSNPKKCGKSGIQNKMCFIKLNIISKKTQMIAQLWDIYQISSLMEETKDISILVVSHHLSLMNENICKTLGHLNWAKALGKQKFPVGPKCSSVELDAKVVEAHALEGTIVAKPNNHPCSHGYPGTTCGVQR